MQASQGAGSLSVNSSYEAQFANVDFSVKGLDLNNAPAQTRSSEPDSFTSIDGQLRQFKILSSLQEGERLYKSEDGIITSKYVKPVYKIHGIYQALYRTRYDQNTESDILTVRSLAQKTISSLANPSSLELISGYADKVNLLYKLKKHVQRCVDVAFPLFITTCASGASNLKVIQEQSSKERKQLADETFVQLKNLQGILDAKIDAIEQINFIADTRHCQNFLELLTGTDFTRLMHQLYPRGGIPTLVCNRAAHEVLSKFFGKELTSRVYKFYKLDTLGMLRMQDFHSLLIGAVANYSLDDLKRHLSDRQTSHFGPVLQSLPVNFQYFSADDFVRLLDLLRVVPLTGIVSPLKRYQAQLERDIAFLQASKQAKAYREAPKYIGYAHRFGYLEYEIRDLLAVFVKRPLCHSADGLLYYSFDAQSRQKCLQVYPIVHQGLLACLVVMPVNHASFPWIRIILTEKDVELSKSSLQPYLESAKRIAHSRPLTVEILCPSGSCSQALTSLLAAVADVTLGDLNCYFFGATTVSSEIRDSFLQFVERNPEVKFSLRYFLERNKELPSTQGAYLGSTPVLAKRLKNLYVSLFHFAREQVYVEPLAEPAEMRYFCSLDERQRMNMSYTAEIVTNNHDDIRCTHGITNPTHPQLVSYDLLNQRLTPVATPNGWFGLRSIVGL